MPERQWIWLFTGILIAAIVVRMWLLPIQFYHVDDDLGSKTYPLSYADMKVSVNHLSKDIIKTVGTSDWSLFSLRLVLSRFISFLLSLASIISFYFLLKKIFPGKEYLLFLGTTLMAFSQMHIIYSIHSGPSIGSLLAINLLVILFIKLPEGVLTLKKALIIILIMALILYNSIQALFILPAGFLTWLIVKKPWKGLTREYLWMAMVGAVTITLVVILYAVKLSDIAHRGINWNAGNQRQFMFPSQLPSVLETIQFFIGNLAIVIENSLAFYKEVPFQEFDNAQLVWGLLFIPLYVAGFIRLFKLNRNFSILCVLFLLTFFVLIFMQKLTLSPTRHNLPYQAIFLIPLLANVYWLPQRFRKQACVLTSLVIIIISGINMKGFITPRKSALSEERLTALIKKEKIDYVLTYRFSYHVLNYKGIENKKTEDFNEAIETGEIDGKRFALVSHRNPLDKIDDYIKQESSWMLKCKCDKVFDRSKSITSIEEPSEVEIGRSQWTSNGTNGFFYYSYRVEPF